MKPQSSTKEAQKRYPGFTDNGRYFESDTKVTNAVTEWVRDMIDTIPRELMSPAEVILQLRLEPQWIRDCFSPQTIANWVRWERFSDWPLAEASSSFTRCLKDFGRGSPIWFRDERRWIGMCDESERRRGLTSRHEGAKKDLSGIMREVDDKLGFD